MTRPVHRREERLIDELCAYLAVWERSRVAVVCRPDRHAGSSDKRCDAILIRGGTRMAVEHTRVFVVHEQPKMDKRLELLRPVFQKQMVACFPHALVRVGVPADGFVPGMDWEFEASVLADKLATALRTADLRQRVVAELPQGRGRAFAEMLQRGLRTAKCVVQPCVWGVDPEDSTVRDIRRALRSKSAGQQAYKSRGFRTILLLEFEMLAWPPFMRDLALRASRLEDLSAYDEVYLALIESQPCDLLPISLGRDRNVDDETLEHFHQMQDAVGELLARRGAGRRRVSPLRRRV